MQSFLLKISVLMTIFLINTSYAFCVYNSTTGNDTLRYDGSIQYKAPTVIKYSTSIYDAKVIDQGDYACTLTNYRGNTDVSTVNVYWAVNANKHYQLFCSLNVYNKGGYMIITGNAQSGFECKVHRDPNKK